jgi:ABC-2 type transport system permease protein
MTTLRLTGIQFRYVNKAFWRNPASAFFTFVFPLMFLVIFTSLLGHYTVRIGSRTIDTSTYYVASMGTFAAISACFNNIAMGITFQREDGVLKRANGTPLPTASFLGARILHAMFISAVLIALTVLFGHFAYQATLPSGLSLLRFIVVVLVGSAAFCALGLALSGAIPNADATAPIVNAVALPVEFLSGIFIAFGNDTPAWILWIARIFPVRHFALGMQAAFLGTPFSWTDVLVVAAWGVAGMLIALRYFHWEPRQG